MEFWFRKKYGLTPNDPRYLGSTLEDMLTDYWAHHYYDNPKELDVVEDEDFDLEAELAKLEEEELPDDFEDLE